MIVREAGEADTQAINALRRQVKLVHAAGRPDFFSDDFNQQLEDYLTIFFRQENAEVFVAEKDRHIVGFACVEYVDRPASPYRMALKYCDVNEFGVDEEHRRQGIGTALFAFIRARAAEKGFSRIELNMWEFNEGALRFYESLGFRTYRRYMEYRMEER